MKWKENKLVRYFIEAKTELEKVVWPTRKETITYTLIVIAVSVGTAAFLAGIDFGLNQLLELTINR